MYLVNWIGERVVADLRSAVYQRVMRMDPAFFEVTKTGEVLSRLTTDTTLIQSLSGIGLSILLRSTVSFFGSLVLLLLTSLKLALIIFALIPTVLLPMLIFGRRVRRLSRDSQDRVADTSGLAGETLNAIQTVQAFTLEELHGRRYDAAVEESFDTAIRRTRVRAWLIAAAIMMTFWRRDAGVVAGRARGARRHDDRRRSREIPELRDLHGHVGGRAVGDVGRAAARRRAPWSAPSSCCSRGRRSSCPPTPVRAEPPTTRRHRASSTCRSTIRRGPTRARSTISISRSRPARRWRSSGPRAPARARRSSCCCGSTTRRRDASSSTASTSRAPIRPAVRARIGLVPQETMIFGASARENIRYGRPGRERRRDRGRGAAPRPPTNSSASCRRATTRSSARRARGCRAGRSSASRSRAPSSRIRRSCCWTRPRARSIPRASGWCSDALEKLMRDRTTLVIAHRLATAINSDRIVVVDRGRIVGIGRHEELLRDNALYARLAELQFGE